MPIQNPTVYCCGQGTADSTIVQAGSCNTSGLSIQNIEVNYDPGSAYPPFDANEILSRTCLEFVCKSGNLHVRATIGCIPTRFFGFSGTDLSIECDVMIGAVPNHRVIPITIIQCPAGTCPEICT